MQTYMERILELYPKLEGREKEFADEFCPDSRFNLSQRQRRLVNDYCVVSGHSCLECWNLPYKGEELIHKTEYRIKKFIEG